MRYSLARDGEPALGFDGTILAHISSERAAKQRWTELTIYKTIGGQYVVQTVAASTRPGEMYWRSARAYVTAEEVVGGMRDRRKQALSKLALDLLESAAVDDDALNEALEAIEDTEEHIK